MSGRRDESVDNVSEKKQSFAHQNPHQCLVGVLTSLRKAETGSFWSELYAEHSYQIAPCLKDPTSRNKNTVGSSHLGIYMNAHRHTHIYVCAALHISVLTHMKTCICIPHTHNKEKRSRNRNANVQITHSMSCVTVENKTEALLHFLQRTKCEDYKNHNSTFLCFTRNVHIVIRDKF